MVALVSIGGFDFPEPSTYNATTSTIVDSAPNIQGKAVCDVFKEYLFITKYFVGWESLEENDTHANFEIRKGKPNSRWA